MKFKGQRKSSNVEDRRSTSSSNRTGLPISLAGGGGIGVVIIFVLFMFMSGGDLGSVLEVLGGTTGGMPTSSQNTSVGTSPKEEEAKEFLGVVLAHSEDVWIEKFKEINRTYTEPTLVLYRNSISSGCGISGSSVGPFYCPGDQKIYIDLSFYDELSEKYKAPGDFAMAYVLAHEVGHHVQEQLGIMNQMNRIRQQVSETEYKKYQVRLELQADYFAGVFAKYIQDLGYLEEGDFDEALQAAFAVGDDTLQKEYQGYVVPDSFTHGTSAQRMEWFKRGFKYGDFEHSDTFNTDL
ncbi:KPN_02809 family neutral zinc metallopeptidase [Granulicatella seriolae]|uniref:Zinc metallopeptidase n=1 Tax=Granulicatella seriolae TaxID=2967226 RepID=A0ABT1WLT7_9LACT|nr:neutral zinc metallopeptidase [Granulicatella seriolae]